MSPRRTEPSVADGYNEWIELVIGTTKKADASPQAGSYGYLSKRVKRLGLTVHARVYPDFGSTTPEQPHLWGVVFPEQTRLTSYDERTQTTKETRPYARQRLFGAKAATLEEAKAQADACIRDGGFDGIDRNDNGTLKALDRDESYDDRTIRLASIADPDDVPFGLGVSDDVP